MELSFDRLAFAAAVATAIRRREFSSLRGPTIDYFVQVSNNKSLLKFYLQSIKV
jgi:hypothetical protein